MIVAEIYGRPVQCSWLGYLEAKINEMHLWDCIKIPFMHKGSLSFVNGIFLVSWNEEMHVHLSKSDEDLVFINDQPVYPPSVFNSNSDTNVQSHASIYGFD